MVKLSCMLERGVGIAASPGVWAEHGRHDVTPFLCFFFVPEQCWESHLFVFVLMLSSCIDHDNIVPVSIMRNAVF